MRYARVCELSRYVSIVRASNMFTPNYTHILVCSVSLNGCTCYIYMCMFEYMYMLIEYVYKFKRAVFIYYCISYTELLFKYHSPVTLTIICPEITYKLCY